MRNRIIAPLLAGLALLTGCATDPRLDRSTLYLTDSGGVVSMPERGRPGYDNVSYWDGDGYKGKPSIVICLSEQRAYFYKDSQLVGVSAISTGREGFNTPLGSYKIIQKDKDHVSSRFGDYLDASGAMLKKDADREIDPFPKGARFDGAKMPFFMRITGGTGMHEGFLPGYPASHGCIRMPSFMAESYFRSVEVGTPVRITR